MITGTNNTVNLTGQEKDSLSVALLVADKNADGIYVPRDITGWMFSTIIRVGETKTSEEASANFVVDVVNATKGLARLTLPKDHGLTAADYWYECDISNATMRETLAEGKLTIEPTLFGSD